MTKLILASNSPRRKQLLGQAGFKFEIVCRDFDEVVDESINVMDIAQNLAEVKNSFYRSILNDELVITADTVVICNNQILGKPSDSEEAEHMLLCLSNNKHDVVTGVCISSMDKIISFDDTTEVSFRNMDRDEIDFYVKKYRPYDKAGAYGIQEWIGMIGIEKIVGSYYNVMGLPIHKVYNCLKEEFGITPY
jgi:septum formation protein